MAMNPYGFYGNDKTIENQDYYIIKTVKDQDYCYTCGKKDVCKYTDLYNNKVKEFNKFIDTPETNWFITGNITCKYRSQNINIK